MRIRAGSCVQLMILQDTIFCLRERDTVLALGERTETDFADMTYSYREK